MKSKYILMVLCCLCLASCGDNEEPSSSQSNTKESVVTTEATAISTTQTTLATTSTETTTTTTASTTTEPSTLPINTNTNTFIASTLKLDIPKSWTVDSFVQQYKGRINPVTLFTFSNGDFYFHLEECENKTEPLTDEEIFDKRTEQFWTEPTCSNVDIYQIGDIKYAKASYNDGSDFHIYTFTHNGYCYQFDVSNLGILPNGEEVIEDIFNSIVFDLDNISLYTIPSYNNLTESEQQHLIKTIMFFNKYFTFPNTIQINQCCQTQLNGENAYLYDLSYTSSSEEETRNTFVFYPQNQNSIIADQSYEQIIGDSDVVKYDSEHLDNVLNEYFAQF